MWKQEIISLDTVQQRIAHGGHAFEQAHDKILEVRKSIGINREQAIKALTYASDQETLKAANEYLERQKEGGNRQ